MLSCSDCSSSKDSRKNNPSFGLPAYVPTINRNECVQSIKGSQLSCASKKGEETSGINSGKRRWRPEFFLLFYQWHAIIMEELQKNIFLDLSLIEF